MPLVFNHLCFVYINAMLQVTNYIMFLYLQNIQIFFILLIVCNVTIFFLIMKLRISFDNTILITEIIQIINEISLLLFLCFIC